ncbi:hypothetical protein ASG37_09865 [Sphingomonas sp. Leaf407]|uniref:DUF4112 domain-containing protein n=1 Tax=unclassified Sphingomonas TaxID=196159 RepID=UPI0006F62085|nr:MULTISPECIES: DUF4112 domain-containing protein [unclassified Sphingomonas]KQN37360.1 hypothetical protein ASE97_07155 [Sphingomonas sp. Leaf42]KQT27729.1 hypothetical protein ASG37_09865 [Sphingomonas sp. Leaf407]
MAKPTRISPEMFDRIAGHLDRDPAAVRRRVVAIERLMERSMTLPGTNQPVGLDFLLNLIPVIGSFIGAAMGSYMLWEARNLGMSKWQMTRMAGNVGVDWALGAIPLVGAIPDFFFRSNTRNLAIIRKHLDRHHPATVTVER